MYGGYGASAGETLWAFLVVLIVAVVVFLIIRALVLWYFRINHIYDMVYQTATEAESMRIELHRIYELLSTTLKKE